MFRSPSIISPQQKVPNVFNRGSLTITSPLAFAEGLFIFFELFYRKRRIFNKLYSIYKIVTKKFNKRIFYLSRISVTTLS